MTAAQATRAEATRAKLLDTGIELVRRQGYAATSVDDICKAAGITKGAFFHHFPSKEALVAACLGVWEDRIAAMHASAPFQQLKSPRKRVRGYFDLFLNTFQDPAVLKSCPAGTTVQETAHTNPTLQAAANTCFVNEARRFQDLLDGAVKRKASSKKKTENKTDTASLAAFWMAAMQGSLLLYKANQDEILFRQNLLHARDYILSQLP